VDPAFSARYCRILVGVFRAAPYSYPWGTSVFVKVTATNIKGTSELSLGGNGAVIIFSPDAPTNLVEDTSQRTASSLGISWTAPVENGGTAILDYRVSRATEGGTYFVLASSTTTSILIVSLSAGTNYQFKVEARNAYGYGPFTEEIDLLCATVPEAPTDPQTTVYGN
jgi:hypothetical protein